MSNKTQWHGIIFWSSLLTVVIISHTSNGLITDSKDLQCKHVQCPTKCPEDSYLKSAIESEEDDFDDYEDEFLGHHDPYIEEEIGNFEEMPPELELQDESLPQNVLKARQRREVFFQNDIESCCDGQKCVCNKCPDVPKCAEGYVAVEVHEGQAVPGNCCSIFRCIQKQQCHVGVKQSWWTNKCRKCSCFGQSELCEQICPEEEIQPSCYSEYWQKPMLNGVFWKEGSCTSCSCELGERRCFTPVCSKLNCKEIIKVKDECCPKCLHDVIEENLDIEHDTDDDFEEDIEEQYITESTTIIDNLVVNENSEQDHSNIPVVDENLSTETQTVTPKSKKLSTTPSTTTYIKSDSPTTQQPELVEHSSIAETSTSPSSSSSSTLSPILQILSTIITSTEVVLKMANNTTTEESQTVRERDGNSSTAGTAIEVTKSQIMGEHAVSATEGTTTESTEEKSTIDRVLVTETMDTNGEQDKAKSIPTEEYIEKTATEGAFSLTPTVSALQSSTSNLAVSASEAINPLSTNNPITSTISTSMPSTTTNGATMSAATQSITSASTTTKDLTSLHAISTEHPFSTAAISTEHPTTSPTSTTSSPYSSNGFPKTTLTAKEIAAISSTTAPDPLRPLHQYYGDVTSEEGSLSTQNQMRTILDEIDYLVIIGLFIGSLLCISLGLIIRHTKNRKKMYSSVPNSETSLSQNSTNTVLTIPSYSDNRYSSSN